MIHGKIVADINATVLQYKNVPIMWHKRIPNDIESVIVASRNPRFFGSLHDEKIEINGWNEKNKSNIILIQSHAYVRPKILSMSEDT
jgi:hypothetical protein